MRESDIPAGVSFEFEGRSYRVEPRNRDTEVLLRRWLERRALEGIREHADAMTVQERAEHVLAWQIAVATGCYAFGTANAWLALLQPDGTRQIAFLHLEQSNPSVTPALIERIFADAEAADRLIAAMAEANGHPAPDPEESSDG